MPYYNEHEVDDCFTEYGDFMECSSCPDNILCEQAKSNGFTKYDLECEPPENHGRSPWTPQPRRTVSQGTMNSVDRVLAMQQQRQRQQYSIVKQPSKRKMALAKDESVGTRFVKNVTMGAARGLLDEAVQSAEEYRQYDLIQPQDELVTRLCKVAAAEATIGVLHELKDTAEDYEIE